MEGDIESEPLALKNRPAIVNGQLVRVSVLYSREYSREKSTKSWEENGDCSPLHTTIKGILVHIMPKVVKAYSDLYNSQGIF